MRSLHRLQMRQTDGASMSSTRYTKMPVFWMIKGWWLGCWKLSGEFLQWAFTKSHKCMTCLPATGLSGWRGVWGPKVSRLRENSMHHTQRLSEVLWIGGRNLPIMPHSIMFQLKATRWISMLLQPAASYKLGSLMPRWFPSPWSSNKGGALSGVAIFKGADIWESPQRGGLHKLILLNVREQTRCCTQRPYKEGEPYFCTHVLLAISPPPPIPHGCI